jgi:4'-phosphopantetheinyl transferase
LSIALQKKPEEILYKFNSFGKPMLLDPNHSNIKFNMSHSKDFAAYIISKEHDVGIDIEWRNPQMHFEEFYDDILTNAEINLLQNSNFNRQEKVNLFFDIWTKKEALVKTLGKGLSYSVKTIDTSNINQQYYIMNGQNLYCKQLNNIAEGYSCAVAIEQPIELSKPLLKVQALSDCLPTAFELLQ